ncbi:MAG: glycerol kinase GlpK [Peptococcaceae bacterium]|nr:glycerol kinase GlpK [Peptococcaceae bacterium]
MAKYILALDQGTTSSRALLFDRQGRPIAKAQQEITQIYPHPGWVEHDPIEIWETQLYTARQAIESAGIKPEDIMAIGIANQRETTVIWNRFTGKPIYNAIVWQCRRTSELCENIFPENMRAYISENTGLLVDAYFSATKIRWLLDKINNGRFLAQQGDLLFGTIDSWLVWNLTGGKLHITDYSNASRTMLYNISNLQWDDKILSFLDIPSHILPTVKQSSEIYGMTDPDLFGAEIPVAGLAGDQQASLFGHTCFEEGMVKNTYGTGCFALMQTGSKLIRSSHKLLTTIAWGLEGKINYALEGSVFIGGAVIQWLRDELGLLQNSDESEEYASQVPDTNGVYFVPAFVGLGAPYWNMNAKGIITGLTRGANRKHIIRAALESIAFQTNDVLLAMQKDTNIPVKALRVDGGAANNKFLMQFQADISSTSVQPAPIPEVTALGAAYLAGLACGFWKSKNELPSFSCSSPSYLPKISSSAREKHLNNWFKAVKQAII